MSIDKIGKMDQGAGINQQPVHHRQPKATDNDRDDDALIQEHGGAKNDLTKISYPPFLPIGDTQSIYKK